ncbi:hydantoin utilization protein C [Peptoclostridium acidaminophilum DSM 3953]|uniref:Hydantoin utilization protein C n=1 Tax=Peptoclostridium acidaminophilum DSM 3953 TaxID=1286171 RepID=W8T8M0_PEPAC|nr:M20 family metallo-hydrolase [Peptoclostridium acidaminophilum]AHM57200.1 hydantoin utilization protein C [Peptoclostridium acidaminophilum DSM 3953]
METNLQRIRTSIEDISRFNSTPGNGCTRFSYSKEDRMAKEYVIDQCLRLGLSVKVDAVGNIRARLEGTEPNQPAIFVGSHIDTVRHGGNFDGVVGVVGAIEAVRTLVENDIRLRCPVEIIIFAEEEGSNCGSTMVGSKAITGKYTVADLHSLKSPSGESCYELAKSFGLNPDQVENHVLESDEVKAMFELHIEQSVVLEREGLPIGIVEAIVGMNTIRIVAEGVPNHAGATPMGMRQDPMAASARLISEIEKIAKCRALPTTVATVGRIDCEPNVPNVIPGRVEFTVDIRDVEGEGIEMATSLIEKHMEDVSREYGLKMWSEPIGTSQSIRLSKAVSGAIEESARELEIPYMRMNSGAVHDAAMLAGMTEVGMIFVPSKNGRSHVPEEFTEYEHIKLGCDILLRAIVKISQM